MGENVPPREKTRVPFRKTRDAIKDIYRHLRAYRPIAGGLLEVSSDGFRVRDPIIPTAAGYIPQFNPTISPIEGDEAKSLTIGKGWVFSEFADNFLSDQFQIPIGHQRSRLPEVAGIPLGGDPNGADPDLEGTLTLAAGTKTNIWLEIVLIRRQVTVGGTTHAVPGSLGKGIFGHTNTVGLGTLTTDEHDEPDHRHSLTGGEFTGFDGGFSHSHNIITSTDHFHETTTYTAQNCYHVSNEAGTVNFIATAEGSDPTEDELNKYLDVGFFELDADGVVIDQEWRINSQIHFDPQTYIKGTSTLERPPGQPSDDASNPSSASAAAQANAFSGEFTEEFD